MFPKNKINIIYRLLCLISFIIVLIMVKSVTTLLILLFVYCILSLFEMSFRNIEFIVVSLFLLLICYLLGNYVILKVILVFDYIFYFLDTTYYYDEKEETKISQKEYIRFAKIKKKKGTSNITAIYMTVHLVILFLAIMVG